VVEFWRVDISLIRNLEWTEDDQVDKLENF
jgi:hypothetical protein